MTHEYLRAVQDSHHFPHTELKRVTRQSLEHSFLPGASLWAQTKSTFRTAAACASDALGAEKPSATCAKFLAVNERAREQWRLEKAFAEFQRKF